MLQILCFYSIMLCFNLSVGRRGSSLLQIANKLMCKTLNSKIPEGHTAEAFSRFFAQKVGAVRAATAAAYPPVFTSCTSCTFESFKPLTQDQILFLIRRAPDKTSELDLIPTWLVRDSGVCWHSCSVLYSCLLNASLRVICLLIKRGRSFI